MARQVASEGETRDGVEPVAGERGVNEVAVEPTRARASGLVGAVDRALPLVWIGLYLLLPVSGWADEMFGSWFDQQRDLEALRELLADGRAGAIADSVIGPAYIGAAALLHEVLGLSAEDSLVVLTRASYALSVAGALLLVRVLLARWTSAPAIVSLAAQFGLLALVFAAGTWYWSDVPWSHFFAAAPSLALFAVRFGPTRPTVVAAAATGALLALLATTRSFELIALVLAWVLAALGVRVLRLAPVTWSRPRLLAGGIAFAATTAVVYAGTGKREPFLLYGNHLDRQSGNLSGVEVAETPTMSLELVPTKLVQLFVDPCYRSLCSVSDYEPGGGAGTNVDLWSLPLAIQLPMLLLLPACIVAVLLLVVRAARGRTSGIVLRPLAEMTIAATGLVVGYAGSTLTGPSHLRYGFARDFLLPALLVAVVAIVLGAVALRHVLARRGRAELVFVATAFAFAALAVGLTTAAHWTGLPRLEGSHLAAVSYTARCSGESCDVALVARTPGGDTISIPGSSTLTFGCGSERPRLTLYVDSLSDSVGVERCADPRLVAAWPTVMGLPPGNFELAAVDVRNA